MNAATAALIGATVRLLTGVTVRWVGGQPLERQRVYFANHTSHLDAVLIWSALPTAIRLCTRPLGASDYWGTAHPLRRFASRLAGVVLVERHNAGTAEREQQVQVILAAMGERGSLIIFPEGTRGAGPGIAPFKSGLYHLGRCRPGLELVPVHLHDVHRVLPKGELLPLPIGCRVTFGPPLAIGADEPKETFLERARDAVRRLESEEAPC